MQAIQRNNWKLCGKVTNGLGRDIDSDPSDKRDPAIEHDAEYGMWRSKAYRLPLDGSAELADYNPERVALSGEDGESDGITPDGPASLSIVKALINDSEMLDSFEWETIVRGEIKNDCT